MMNKTQLCLSIHCVFVTLPTVSLGCSTSFKFCSSATVFLPIVSWEKWLSQSLQMLSTTRQRLETKPLKSHTWAWNAWDLANFRYLHAPFVCSIGFIVSRASLSSWPLLYLTVLIYQSLWRSSLLLALSSLVFHLLPEEKILLNTFWIWTLFDECANWKHFET